MTFSVDSVRMNHLLGETLPLMLPLTCVMIAIFLSSCFPSFFLFFFFFPFILCFSKTIVATLNFYPIIVMELILFLSLLQLESWR